MIGRDEAERLDVMAELPVQYTEQPELAHLADDLRGQRAVAVPLGRVRGQAFGRELPCGIADHALFVGVELVHGGANKRNRSKWRAGSACRSRVEV